MRKIKIENRNKKKYLKIKYTPDRLERLKEKGTTINLDGRKIRINPINERYSKKYLPPKVSVFEESETQIGINFSVPVVADKVFIDVKKINRFNTRWMNIAIFNNIKKDKEHTFFYNATPGESLKVRITYHKGDYESYSDFLFEDPNFKYYSDPPEMIIQKRKNISLAFFNLERFLKNGYIRVFRKENSGIETCILSQKINNRIIEYTDENVDNYSYYEYRAEIYDSIGGLYNILPVKTYFQRSSRVRPIKIKYNKSNQYEFDVKNETRFQIQKYNIETEEVEILKYTIRNKKVIFNPVTKNDELKKFPNGNFIIQVEGYIDNETHVSWAEIRVNNPPNVEISQASVKTNKQNENVLMWKATGEVDRFVILKRNANGIKLLGSFSHRETKDGYMYCIDSEYIKKRFKTTYIINAVDNFGKIISKKEVT